MVDGIKPEHLEEIPFAFEPRPTANVETRFRRIATPIPVPESMELLKTLSEAEARAFWANGPPVVWDRAKGSRVWDPYGNCWIDFTAAAYTANCGHNHPRVIEALRRQLDRPLTTSFFYPTETRARLVKKLTTLRPGLDCAMLFNTGSEAIEVAVKLTVSRATREQSKRSAIIGFERAYHGKTLGSAQVGGIAPLQKWIPQAAIPVFACPSRRPATMQRHFIASSKSV